MYYTQARNGMQQSPMYPMPYPSSSHQQQPLFIIIPSTSGKSHKPHIVPASQYASRSYTDSVPYPQNLLLRRSLIRNKPTKYPQKRPSKRQFLLDKLKHQVDSGGKATSGSPSELVVLSERASDLSLVPTKIRSSAGKRQASPMLDDFQTTSVQADWASDK